MPRNISKATEALRSLTRQGFRELASNGVRQAHVAKKVGASAASVSRWANGGQTIPYAQAEALCREWPTCFDADSFRDAFQRQAVGLGGGDRLDYLQFRLCDGPAAVYSQLASALAQDRLPADQVILHSALHLDVPGLVHIDTDGAHGSAAATAMAEAKDKLEQRASEGWRLRHVTCVGRAARLDDLVAQLGQLDGANVRSRAYLSTVPPLLNLFVIGNSDVFIAAEHVRWGKPGSALHLVNRPIASWATAHFEALFEGAPFQLRGPAGVSQEAVVDLRAVLARSTT